MRPSFVRLVVFSVIACWLAGFLVMVAYGRSLSWIDDRARDDGIFLFQELLDETPPEHRAERVEELAEHTNLTLALVSIDEVEERVGRRPDPGEAIPLRISRLAYEEWYYMTFEDGSGALAVGPVAAAIPAGVLPVGALVAVLGLPLIAGLVALRVEWAFGKVEAATEAIAVGELGARVLDARGPSREIAERFNAMAERVEMLVRSRDELVQAVSHELGSPLSRLRFHMELLETEAEAEREGRIAAMTRELDALDELVAELLGYVQSDNLQIDQIDFDPSRVLADLAELATLEAHDEGTVSVALDVPAGIQVHADQRYFQRAVENLLRNAMRYAQSQVRLEVSQTPDGVRVAVHDDGPGIPEDLRKKVTQPFVRLDAHRNRKTGGVGLGLAIVRRIMHRHGGRLEIDDSPLGGAVVATVWPA